MFFGNKILNLESDFRKLGSVAVLRSVIRILRASVVQIDMEMAEKYAKQLYAASCSWKIRRIMCQHHSLATGQH